MNSLLTAMSQDLGITPYKNEKETDYNYRVCYSALGLWCLKTAQSSFNGIIGTSKRNQTVIIDELLSQYVKLFPFIADKFIDNNKATRKLSLQIRRIYEETGYLLTEENNRNSLANYGRTIMSGRSYLFFGIPYLIKELNGLGIYTDQSHYESNIFEILIRDMLSSEEYFSSRFDLCDFYEKDIDDSDLQFFNPLLNKSPSNSWGVQMLTDCTVARKIETNTYYRVMRQKNDIILFVDEPIAQSSDDLVAYDFRRLYFALKAHYQHPLLAWIEKIDDNYSKLKLSGYLPNREYYYLLLSAWPLNGAFDKVNYIIKNDLINTVSKVLEHIGIVIVIKGGNMYV